MLRVEGLQAGYGEAQVLFGIDLDVEAGEVVTLLGRNGMAKPPPSARSSACFPSRPAVSRSTARI